MDPGQSEKGAQWTHLDLIEGVNGGVDRRNRFQMRPTQVEFPKTSAISGLVIDTPRIPKCVPENRPDEKPEQPNTPVPEAHEPPPPTEQLRSESA